jgi:uncharacterized protein
LTPSKIPYIFSCKRRTQMKNIVITGASSGIGKIYAEVLASDTSKLFLVARRKEKLEMLADKLGNCEVITADLATDEGMKKVSEEILKIKPDMLINNAGIGGSEEFIDSDIEFQIAKIKLHNEATVRLSHSALQSMIPRGSGDIINVSSLAAWLTFGGDIVYSASKMFLVSFTKSLDFEFRDKGIRVQVLCPGFTRTEFFENNDIPVEEINRFGFDEPIDIVKTSLKFLSKNKVVCIPTAKLRFFKWLLFRSPFASLISKIAKREKAKRLRG